MWKKCFYYIGLRNTKYVLEIVSDKYVHLWHKSEIQCFLTSISKILFLSFKTNKNQWKNLPEPAWGDRFWVCMISAFGILGKQYSKAFPLSLKLKINYLGNYVGKVQNTLRCLVAFTVHKKLKND